jgi:hypothetical protein
MNMDTRKLVLPAAVFVGGALLGRLFGLRGLVRAGMAALTVARMSETAGLLTAGKSEPQRKAPAKLTRRRSAKKGAARPAAKRANHSTTASTTH